MLADAERETRGLETKGPVHRCVDVTVDGSCAEPKRPGPHHAPGDHLGSSINSRAQLVISRRFTTSLFTTRVMDRPTIPPSSPPREKAGSVIIEPTHPGQFDVSPPISYRRIGIVRHEVVACGHLPHFISVAIPAAASLSYKNACLHTQYISPMQVQTSRTVFSNSGSDTRRWNQSQQPPDQVKARSRHPLLLTRIASVSTLMECNLSSDW